MDHSAQLSDWEVMDELGEPVLVCRTRRSSIFFCLLIASVTLTIGAVALVVFLKLGPAIWAKDIIGSILLLAASLLFLKGAWALWQRANRMRSVRVIVHSGGLSRFFDGSYWTCRWHEIESIQWKVLNHFTTAKLADGRMDMGNSLPDPTTGDYSHTTHQFTVRRNDGIEMVFNDELENIVGLVNAVQNELRKYGNEKT